MHIIYIYNIWLCQNPGTQDTSRYPSHSWLWMALPQNMIIKFDPIFVILYI